MVLDRVPDPTPAAHGALLAAAPRHLAPLEVAPDTFLLRSAQPMLGAPLSVATNSLVIRSGEPILIDTGSHADREPWLRDLFSLVEPAALRWVFLSDDAPGHRGNLAAVLERCPNATVVTTWAASERLRVAGEPLPPRLRWVDERGTVDVGDRVLRTLRPPVYASPASRAVFDRTTGVLWACDAFATPMPLEPVDHVDQLPRGLWAEGTALLHHHALAPWLPVVDRQRYAAEVERLRGLGPEVVVGAHCPVIDGASIAAAFERLAALPDLIPPPHPVRPGRPAAGSEPAT